MLNKKVKSFIGVAAKFTAFVTGPIFLGWIIFSTVILPFYPSDAYATATVLPQPVARFFNAAGAPLAGGKVYTYAAGTTTPLASYTDSTALVQNTNPVILDSTGSAPIWISGAYKVVLQDSNGVVQWTQDNIQDLFTYNQIQSTSTTSLSIANSASKTFTTQSGKYFSPGVYVLAVETSAPTTNQMHGVITSYTGTQLVITTDAIKGSGTYSDWTINLSGPIGPTGPTGPTGSGAGDMTGVTNLAQGVGGVASTATARANLGLGTAATRDTGTSASQVVLLDGSAKLPAVDGSALTNIVVSGVPVVTAGASGHMVIGAVTIEWGTGTATTGAGTAVTFSPAYSGAPYSVQVTATQTSQGNVPVGALNPVSTGFSLGSYNVSNIATTWLAFGPT